MPATGRILECFANLIDTIEELQPVAFRIQGLRAARVDMKENIRDCFNLAGPCGDLMNAGRTQTEHGIGPIKSIQ